MSLSSDRSTVTRVQKEINDLQRRQNDESKKVAEANKRANAAMSSAARASSPSMANSYTSAADREMKNATDAQDRAARYGTDISRKMDELTRAQERVVSGEEKERKDLAATYEKQRKIDEAARKKLQDDNRALARDLGSLRTQFSAAIETQAGNTQPFVVERPDGKQHPYDFFVSHATADKEEFVDGLVTAARNAGLDVWYDRNAMAWGGSIRQKIDEGLRLSYFGVVVFSPSFFGRPWTNYELDAIVQRDLSGSGRLLPIWHRITQDEVAAKVPALAGRYALPTSIYSTADIVKELVSVRDRFKAAAR